jgi:succinate dehydrogenase / fumarate reductase cytochrome b subunit
MAEVKKHPNRLGVSGWLLKGRWGWERYLYSLHRITGLGLVVYFLMHIFVTSTRSFGGKAAWESVMGAVESPFFKVGEFLVFAAFAFHALNGIRLILIELGGMVGKAEEPVYPYQSSLNVQRPLSIVVFLLAAVVVLVGGYQFIIGH